jgi:hypothetical protein
MPLPASVGPAGPPEGMGKRGRALPRDHWWAVLGLDLSPNACRRGIVCSSTGRARLYGRARDRRSRLHCPDRPRKPRSRSSWSFARNRRIAPISGAAGIAIPVIFAVRVLPPVRRDLRASNLWKLHSWVGIYAVRRPILAQDPHDCILRSRSGAVDRKRCCLVVEK